MIDCWPGHNLHKWATIVPGCQLQNLVKHSKDMASNVSVIQSKVLHTLRLLRNHASLGKVIERNQRTSLSSYLKTNSLETSGKLHWLPLLVFSNAANRVSLLRNWVNDVFHWSLVKLSGVYEFFWAFEVRNWSVLSYLYPYDYSSESYIIIC